MVLDLYVRWAFARHFGVLILFVCLFVCLFVLRRLSDIPGAPPPTVHRDTTLNNIVAIICALLFAGGIVLAVNLICKCKNRGIYSSRFKLLRCTVKSTSQLRDGTSLAQKRIVDLPSLRDSYSMTAKTQHCSCPMLKAVSLDVESQLPVGDPGAARNPVRNAYSMNDVAAAEGPATLAVEHATGAISINQLQDEVRSAEEKVADLSLLHDPMAGKKRCSSWPVLDTVSLGAGHQLPAGVRRASRTSVRPAYSTNGVTAEEGPASFEDATGVPVTNKDSSQTVGIGGSLYATLASSAPMNQDVLAMLRTCTNILQHTGENGEESDLVLSSSSGEVTTYHFGAKQGIEKSSPNRQSAVMSHSPTEITPQSSSRGAPDTQQWPPQAPTVPRGKTMPSTDTTHGTVVDVPLGLPTVPGRLHHCSASASDIGEKVVELSILSATPTTTSNTHPANSPVSTAFKQQAAACNSSQTDTMSQTEDRASPETFDPLTHSCSQQSSTPLPGPTSLEESKSAFTSLTCLPSEEDSDGRDFTISGLYAAAEKNGPSSVATIYHQERPTNSSPLSPIRLIASPKTGDPIPKSFVSQSTTPLPDTSESQVASSNSQPFMADSDTRDFTISGWFATADINHQVASIQSSQALPLSQTVSTAPLEANFPLRNNFFNESNTHFLIPRFI